jgi:hypothetical protein
MQHSPAGNFGAVLIQSSPFELLDLVFVSLRSDSGLRLLEFRVCRLQLLAPQPLGVLKQQARFFLVPCIYRGLHRSDLHLLTVDGMV